MNTTIVWQKKTAKYETGESGWLGKVKVFSYHWNAMRSRNAEVKAPDWVLCCHLPGMLERFPVESEEKAKHVAAGMLEAWLHHTGISEKTS